MHDGKAGGYSERADSCALCLVHARIKVLSHTVALFLYIFNTVPSQTYI
jgi:hypothetical protein